MWNIMSCSTNCSWLSIWIPSWGGARAWASVGKCCARLTSYFMSVSIKKEKTAVRALFACTEVTSAEGKVYKHVTAAIKPTCSRVLWSEQPSPVRAPPTAGAPFDHRFFWTCAFAICKFPPSDAHSLWTVISCAIQARSNSLQPKSMSSVLTHACRYRSKCVEGMSTTCGFWYHGKFVLMFLESR